MVGNSGSSDVRYGDTMFRQESTLVARRGSGKNQGWFPQ
jgi:hypothetical protein